MSLLCVAIPNLTKSTAQLVQMNNNDIKSIVLENAPETIKFRTREKVFKEYNGKTVGHTKHVEKSLAKEAFVSNLMKLLPPFRSHCERVGIQYLALKKLEENLPVNECVVQIHYAENWNCSYLKEITSAYYSKDQITIHPMVTKERNENGDLMILSYVGVSNVTSDSFPTTLVFLKELVAKLLTKNPNLHTVHIVSDSPSSQYRNRYTCQLRLRFPINFNLNAIWNWLESGHGKGPCDGVGGSIKRLADRIVKNDIAIQSAPDFYNTVSAETQKMERIYITEQQVKESNSEIQKWESPPVKGLMEMHQAAVINGELYTRPTSCYNSCCFNDGRLTNGCPGWRRCNITVNNSQANDWESYSDSSTGEASDGTDDGDDNEDELPLSELSKRWLRPNEKETDSNIHRRVPETSKISHSNDSDNDTEDDVPLSILCKQK